MVKKVGFILLSCFLVVFSVFSINLNTINFDFVSAEETTISDLTGYQWYGNEILNFDNLSGTTTFSLNGLWGVSYSTLTSNFVVQDYSFAYKSFRGLQLVSNSSNKYLKYYLSDGNTISNMYVASSGWGGFSNYEPRYILFLGGTDCTNTNLISWLSANGTFTYVGVGNIVETIINNNLLNPVVYKWNDNVDLSVLENYLSFSDSFYFMNNDVLYSSTYFILSNNFITYTYNNNSSSVTENVYSIADGWVNSSYKVLYFPTSFSQFEYYIDNPDLYSFMLANGVVSDYNSFTYDSGYIDGYNDAYNDAYNAGLEYATNMFSGYGPFLYSTWSIVNRFDYTEVLGGFTGRFNADNFNAFNGGFTFSDNLHIEIEDYFIENEDSEGVFKVDFDNYLPVSKYIEWVTYEFGFGNELTFILDNGSKVYFNNVSITKSINLSDYSNYNIVSIIISFGSSFSDYGYFGLSANSNFMFAYQNGYNDGYIVGHSNGYNSGFSTGKASGYNDGLSAANEYTFFSLISAVVDAPIKAFSSLFNFDILGVNILSLLTGLFTLLLVVVVIKFFMGGK